MTGYIPQKYQRVRTYARRESRMTAAQRRAIENLSELYVVPSADTSLELEQIFSKLNRFALEVGFGDGEALVHLARNNPDTGYLGIEVYRPGIGRCLLALHRWCIDNVRVSTSDARDVLALQLPPRSLSEIFFHFPDPWPKRKHQKRRLIQPAFVELCASRLADDGRIIFVTDSGDYAAYARERFAENDQLRLLGGGQEFSSGRLQRSETRYERKALERGNLIYEYVFQHRRAAD